MDLRSRSTWKSFFSLFFFSFFWIDTPVQIDSSPISQWVNMLIGLFSVSYWKDQPMNLLRALATNVLSPASIWWHPNLTNHLPNNHWPDSISCAVNLCLGMKQQHIKIILDSTSVRTVGWFFSTFPTTSDSENWLCIMIVATGWKFFLIS